MSRTKKARFQCYFELQYRGAYVIEADSQEKAEEMLDKQVNTVAPTLKMFNNEMHPTATTRVDYIPEKIDKPRCIKPNSDGSWSLLEEDREMCRFHIGDFVRLRDTYFSGEYQERITGVRLDENESYIIDGNGLALSAKDIVTVEVIL